MFHTGWNRKMFGEPNYYFDNPFVTVELARWLVSKRIKALALDSPQDQVQGKGEPRPGDSRCTGPSWARGFPSSNTLPTCTRCGSARSRSSPFPSRSRAGTGAVPRRGNGLKMDAEPPLSVPAKRGGSRVSRGASRPRFARTPNTGGLETRPYLGSIHLRRSLSPRTWTGSCPCTCRPPHRTRARCSAWTSWRPPGKPDR